MNFPITSRRGKLLLGIGSLFCLYILAIGVYRATYQGRILPGVYLETQALGGLSKPELLAQSEAQRQTLAQQQRPLTLEQPTTHAKISLATTPFLTTDGERLWEQAYREGRSLTSPWTYAPFLLPVGQPSLSITESLRINEATLREQFASAINKAGWSSTGTPATFIFSPDTTNAGQLQVSIAPGVNGQAIDVDTSLARIADGLRTQPAEAISVALLPATVLHPTTAELQPFLSQAQQWLTGPVQLHTPASETSLSASQMASLLTIATTTSSNGALQLTLDPQKTEQLLTSLPFAQTQEPRDGYFRLNEKNEVTEVVAPTQGQHIDVPSTLASLMSALDNPLRTATATVVTAYGSFTGPEAEQLGIKEFLGEGHSSFSGSPSNRRKNIALGGDRVHQTLVAPNTDFSLLQVLGDIDQAHGWLPELVIKGNKTLPEYGGGLCQIGTTIFRAALNVGLPITERRNHSYRVSYYEPAGTDATIYDPAPDFKFKNDTPNWLLVTQKFSGDNISFLIWGTKDGRVASSSTPVVTNIVQPPPKKIIETTEIPVGTTKCTETAHAGATAAFDYEVSYSGGDVKKTTFTSVYRPWQAVCLVGVAQVTSSTTSDVDATGLNSAG